MDFFTWLEYAPFLLALVAVVTAAFTMVAVGIVLSRTISTLVMAAVTTIAVILVEAVAAADAQRRFFSDFNRCRIRFFCQLLNGSG